VKAGQDCPYRNDRHILHSCSSSCYKSTMVLSVESCQAAERYAALLPLQEAPSFIMSFLTIMWRSFWCLLVSPLTADLLAVPQECPGYVATYIHTTDSGWAAGLRLAGKPCNIYGNDLKHLHFKAEYQTGIALEILFIFLWQYTNVIQSRDYTS
jgi:hypothetical protein